MSYTLLSLISLWVATRNLAFALALPATTVNTTSSISTKEVISSNATTTLSLLLNAHYLGTVDAASGTFDRSQQGPWWESGTIWATYTDYALWTGDGQYRSTVANALKLASAGDVQDFLGADHNYTSTTLGYWNDDIQWWALAAIGSAAFTGTTNTTASAEDVSEAASGVTLAQKTLDEVYDFHTDACGGGILWTRNPAAKNNYKSSITQLLFLSLSARTHLITGNQTILQQAEDMMSWLLASKVVDLEAGVVNDGIDALSCGIVTTQWTYNYGVLLGSLAWLYQATNNDTYLTYAPIFLQHSIDLFATDGIVKEQCETDGSCDQDQQIFKAIYLRNLGYLYDTIATKVPTNFSTFNVDSVQSRILNVVQKSAQAAVASCDSQWNCQGQWDGGSKQTYPTYRSLANTAAALVAQDAVQIAQAEAEAAQQAAQASASAAASASRNSTSSTRTITTFSTAAASTASQTGVPAAAFESFTASVTATAGSGPNTVVSTSTAKATQTGTAQGLIGEYANGKDDVESGLEGLKHGYIAKYAGSTKSSSS